jgi:hypothetical protein
MEQFLCFKELEKTATDKYVFNILKEYLLCSGLIWKPYVDICTDGVHGPMPRVKKETISCRLIDIS